MWVLWWELFATWLSDGEKAAWPLKPWQRWWEFVWSSVALKKHQMLFWNLRGAAQILLCLQSHTFLFWFPLYFPPVLFFSLLSISTPDPCPSSSLPPSYAHRPLIYPSPCPHRLLLSVCLSKPLLFILIYTCCAWNVLGHFLSLFCNLEKHVQWDASRTRMDLTQLVFAFLSSSLQVFPLSDVCLALSFISLLSLTHHFSFFSLISLSLPPPPPSLYLPSLYPASFASLLNSVSVSPHPHPSIHPPVAVSSALCCWYPWWCQREPSQTCSGQWTSHQELGRLPVVLRNHPVQHRHLQHVFGVDVSTILGKCPVPPSGEHRKNKETNGRWLPVEQMSATIGSS